MEQQRNPPLLPPKNGIQSSFSEPPSLPPRQRSLSLQNSSVSHIPTSVGINEVNRNIILSRAIELTQTALREDEEGNLQAALDGYQQALEIFVNLMKVESKARKQMIKQKVTQILDRAETIKKILKDSKNSSNQFLTQKSNSSFSYPENNEMTECTILMNVQGIKCFSIVGTDKQLIAEGNLQLLKTKDLNQLHLLKLDEFEFPLTKSIPCLRISRGHYMLPMPGNVFYGFVFPREIADSYLVYFEKLLDQICVFKSTDAVEYQPQTTSPVVTQQSQPQIRSPSGVPPPSSDRIQKLASGIETGGQYLASSIQTGGEYLASGIETTGEYIKSKIVPNEAPSEVNSAIATSIKVASYVSPYCVSISKGIVNGLATVAKEIGSACVNAISETEWMKRNEGIHSEKIKAAKELGKSSLSAFVNVWEALENSGKVLLDKTKHSTVDIVTYKYGPNVGQVTDDGISVGIDAAVCAINLKNLGVKHLAKQVAISTGKQIAISSENETEQLPPSQTQNQITSPSYPALPSNQ